MSTEDIPTTGTDWRALCEELVDAYAWCIDEYMTGSPSRKDSLVKRARAALAQPEPVGPTESDVTELFYRQMGEGYEVGFENAIAEALARWGRPAIQPVPVAERLPEAGDCDAEGCCWWWRTDGVEEHWELTSLVNPVGHNASCSPHVSYGPWLPCHALPIPTRQEVLSDG